MVFEDPGRLTEDVVHLHLEQRMAQRLLARFRAQGFVHHDFSRACLAHVADSVRRVVLIGRLSLYGERAERLHEEIVTVTARWVEPGLRRRPLQRYAADAERKSLALLDQLLDAERASQPNETIRRRLLGSAERDIDHLRPQWGLVRTSSGSRPPSSSGNADSARPGSFGRPWCGRGSA